MFFAAAATSLTAQEPPPLREEGPLPRETDQKEVDEDLMRLLEDQAAKAETQPPELFEEKRRRRPRYGADLTLGLGWVDNVFRASANLERDDFGPRGIGDFIFGRDELRQDDYVYLGEFDSFLDIPLGRDWTLENELTLNVEEYDELNVANLQRLEYEVELHYSPGRMWDTYVGGQVIRRLHDGTNDLGTKFRSDFDYYRFDGYAGVERRLGDSDWLDFEYRRVWKDYDETTGLLSDDYGEDRVLAEWKHRFSREWRTILSAEGRFREYREEYPRDREGNLVPGEEKHLDLYRTGVDLYWTPSAKTMVQLEADLKLLRDPFDRYYDYTGYEIGIEYDQEWGWNLYTEFDASYEDRDYPNRKFLKFGPDTKIEKYELYDLEFTLGYRISPRYQVELVYDGSWRRTNDEDENYNVNAVALQFVLRL